MKISIRIDGKDTQVEKGTLLLKAARMVGVDIPALCHHDALPPYGACRLCLVEIENRGRSRITASCNYPVLHDGESVSTGSDRVMRARRVVMELLLARCPGSKPVQELARRIGVEPGRFPAPAPSRLPAGEAALTGCVLCGLCVRACEEAIGASAISFSDRGPNRRVASPFFVSTEACIGCGACAAVCPTGVIELRDGADGKRLLPFLNIQVDLMRCASCGSWYGPHGQIEKLRAKVPAVEESLSLCPVCRRKETGARLARESVRRGQAPGLAESATRAEATR